MDIVNLYQLFVDSNGIVTDTRKLVKGGIYFALKGSNFDGNRFADDALLECNYAVVDNPDVVKDNRYILVEDVLTTLQKLANMHRQKINPKVIAITGTNGKTTTKELVTRVLLEKYQVLYTQGNLNNHIGVPLTLLNLKPHHKFAIIEMGANAPGDIELLCTIADPDFGLITNVGKAHLEGFGSFDGVKATKGELYKYLCRKGGVAFVNYDNSYLEEMNPPNRTVYYGTRGFTHCEGRLIETEIFLKFSWFSSYDITSDDEEINWENPNQTIQTHLVGSYNLENALAAVCIGLEFGISSLEIKKAIESYIPVNNRSQFIQTKDNKIIMDAYNANPSSVKIALDNFNKLPMNDKLLIVGDMLELGEASFREHHMVYSLMLSVENAKIMLVGQYFNMLEVDSETKKFENTNALIEFLKVNKITGKAILIKGSRGIGLEKVLDFL